jgi:hypothetical protein
MRTYEIHSIENNLASLQTTVRFRVWSSTDALDRLLDECKVTLEGRYDLNEDGLMDQIEEIYEREVVNA